MTAKGLSRCRLGEMLAVAAIAVTFGGGDASAQTQPSLDGVWRIEKPLSALRTVQGEAPPLTTEAAKKYRENLAARTRDDLSYDSASWCAAVGMPRIMLIDYPFQIMVRPQYVAFFHEWNWWARIVYLDGALSDTPLPPPGPPPGQADGPGGPPPPMAAAADTPGPMGLSKGQWEGDTLVVKTAHLDNSKLLDNSGVPYSGALKVTERIRAIAPDILEDRIQFDDPITFTRPWETVVTYRRQPGGGIKEDVCLDRIKSGEPAVKE